MKGELRRREAMVITMSKSIIAFILAILCAASTSCAQQAQTDGDANADTTAAETAELVGREAVSSSVPDTLNFDGETVTILTRSESGFPEEFLAEEENGDIINDTVYKRDQYVTERLNCSSDVVTRAGGWGEHVNFMNSVTGDVMAGDQSYDIISYYAYCAPMLATQNILFNLYDIEHLDLSKPWWHQSFVENATVYDKLYHVAGDINLTTVSYRYAIFFNKTLSDIYVEDNLYSLVDDGKWTLDKFLSCVKDIWIDVDGDGISEETDILGWEFGGGYDAIAAGCRFTYTEKTDDGGYKWNFYTERNNDIIEKYFSLKNLESVFYKDNYTNTASFYNSMRVFYPSTLNLSDQLRDMRDEYGILPFPKYDEAQDGYYTTVNDNYSQIMIPLTCKNIELAGAFLELSGEYSYKYLTPAYFEVAMKTKYLRDNDSARMFDIIMEGASYDFAVINSAVIGDPVFITRNSMQEKGGNFASQYASQESVLEAKLEELLEVYREE